MLNKTLPYRILLDQQETKESFFVIIFHNILLCTLNTSDFLFIHVKSITLYRIALKKSQEIKAVKKHSNK